MAVHEFRQTHTTIRPHNLRNSSRLCSPLARDIHALRREGTHCCGKWPSKVPHSEGPPHSPHQMHHTPSTNVNLCFGCWVNCLVLSSIFVRLVSVLVCKTFFLSALRLHHIQRDNKRVRSQKNTQLNPTKWLCARQGGWHAFLWAIVKTFPKFSKCAAVLYLIEPRQERLLSTS